MFRPKAAVGPSPHHLVSCPDVLNLAVSEAPYIPIPQHAKEPQVGTPKKGSLPDLKEAPPNLPRLMDNGLAYGIDFGRPQTCLVKRVVLTIMAPLGANTSMEEKYFVVHS